MALSKQAMKLFGRMNLMKQYIKLINSITQILICVSQTFENEKEKIYAIAMGVSEDLLANRGAREEDN